MGQLDRNEPREAQVREMIRRKLLEAAPLLKEYRVFLYGSRATGQARPRSDFDLGVYGDRPLPIKIFFEIEAMLDELPTLYKIDWVDFNRASQEFRERAMRDVEIMYE
jgi:predicted nucleotidyltransferase